MAQILYGVNMPPIEIDFFNGRTEVSIQEYEIADGKEEIIEALPPAIIRVQGRKKRGILSFEGNINYLSAVLFKDEADKKGVDFDVSQTIYFGGTQTVEISSSFHDEMYAFRYVQASGNIVVRETKRSSLLIPA